MPSHQAVRLIFVSIGVATSVAAAIFVPGSILNVAPPQSGELVPRQIAYRGHIEQSGTAVVGTLSMTFDLTYSDGGVGWSSGVMSVPVHNGDFSVALGDSTSNLIPGTVFDDLG